MPNSAENARKLKMPVTEYVWDYANDSYLMEKDVAGTTTAVYTTEPAEYGKLVSQRRDNASSYCHFDGQQSTRQLTDSTQVTTDEYTYSAFGETVVRTGAATNPFRYVGSAGYHADSEMNSTYVRRRDYRPTIARWQSTDPLFFAATNQYQYARSAIVNWYDPYSYAHNNKQYTLTPATGMILEICVNATRVDLATWSNRV
jgi:RHS repeat-associated protein